MNVAVTVRGTPEDYYIEIDTAVGEPIVEILSRVRPVWDRQFEDSPFPDPIQRIVVAQVNGDRRELDMSSREALLSEEVQDNDSMIVVE